MKKVAIIMGSDSDLPVVRKAADTLAEYGVPYEVHTRSILGIAIVGTIVL